MSFLLFWWHFLAVLKKTFFRVIFGSRFRIGKKTTFRKQFSVVVGKDGKITIGDHCFFNNSCSLASLGTICIGTGSIFGEGVKIYDHNHRFSDFSVPIKDQDYSIGTVVIGNHCWIGSNVVILKNTIIEDNCVIGAGCIISGTIKKNTIVKNNNNTYVKEQILEKGN